MGDLKLDSLQFICNKIGVTPHDLFEAGRYGGKENVKKRWAVFYFYHLMGKSYPCIAKITHKNHTSVMHGVKNIDPDTKAVAEEFFCQYVTKVLGEPAPKIEKTEEKKFMVWKKVPDYKHSKTVMKQVEVKPQEVVKWWKY